MTKVDRHMHPASGLSDGALTIALLLKYLILSAYGVWATVVETSTFVIIGSSLFATVWAAVVAVTAGLAAAGVIRSWMTGRRAFEHVSTAAFILVFMAYAYALIWRAISENSPGSAPLALVAVAVCVLPTVRFYSIVLRGRIIFPKGAK
jgi:hypothetical protein